MICFPKPQRTVKAFASAVAVVIGLWVTPTLAGDPFRQENPHTIDEQTEAAFESIFKEGNYTQAKEHLEKAEANKVEEPLVYAMLASLAYIEKDWETLKKYASKTRETAEQLTTTDPLRGNLYTAAGHFLEGSYNFKKEGPVRALSKLQKVLQYVDKAKEIDPNDPELNLLTGYMDLMLAVNVPFADPANAVEKLETYGNPKYVAYRGIAVGYRDLKEHNKAMNFVDRALELAPNNPDLFYLKAQILRNQGKEQESLAFFKQALDKRAQLPERYAAQIAYENCRAENSIANGNRDCRTESGL
ncbi:MAG: tetratricopeptide repeat protein [Symploca sp. SIO2D2]|nr:tetratricopeptide repeat protein [Symploca sp. SIO2D2]